LEANTLLDTVLSASRRRNDLVHGIVTNWSSHISADQTILRTTSAGYVAIQDVPISKSDLIELSRDINILSVKLFSLQENVKSIARFLNGDDKFWMTATLQVPDG
jgi:hypothetical protein